MSRACAAVYTLHAILTLTVAVDASGGEIVLGMSAAFSGPSRSLGLELYRGARAHFETVNESGGIHGQEVHIRALDDGYEPGPAVANTLELLADGRVVALFGYVGTPTVTRVLPLLARHDGAEPQLFFAFTGAQPLRRPPYGRLAFNLRASYADETAGLVERFLEIGRDRVGLFYQADAYGRSGWSGVRDALRARGLAIAAEATYRRGTGFGASFSEHVDILRGVDVVISVGSYEACAGFVRDARDGGLDVPIANVSFVGSERLLELLVGISNPRGDYTRGLVNSQVVPSYEDTSLPAVREYREALERHDPDPPAGVEREAGATNRESFVGFEGFLDAKLMTEILRRAGPSPSRDALRTAAESIDDFDLGIGTKIGYGPEDRTGLERIWYTTVRDGRFVAFDEWSILSP